ncbi:hypothetical protein AQUCO_04500247v1 [Aquilegia coerulea]|uniref:Polymerase nucleotidyl transferase domain-containing protein n=1 Tax=Aquilegia coerulea TaxID=218851 RepID=A0A2G5CMF6_AQUCA|nr:hypothetical protein AQUCO_04500247v1 [Aquilegia coerulea]
MYVTVSYIWGLRHIVFGRSPLQFMVHIDWREVTKTRNHLSSNLEHPCGFLVLPFGSVPLNTYLPDGDIDLTALSSQNVEDVAKGMEAILRHEQQNITSAYEVKDVQYICAQVQLIKCLVQSIILDISFNQYGGFSTIHFLQQVDCYIGHGHLFKRSIILVKAWCYYESRVLGAHHGLISTYALEIMVLYIFQFFSRDIIAGSLEVLYRLLNYVDKFDWNNYYISINAPINGVIFLSCLPQIVVKKPEIDGSRPLLSKEYLRHFAEMPETNSHAFQKKHLNIIDPLRENNNLERSVSQGIQVHIPGWDLQGCFNAHIPPNRRRIPPIVWQLKNKEVLPDTTPPKQSSNKTSHDTTLRIPEQGMNKSNLDSTNNLKRYVS